MCISLLKKKKKKNANVGYRKKIFEAWDALKNVRLVLAFKREIFSREIARKVSEVYKDFPSYWFTIAPHCIRTHAHVHPTQIIRNNDKRSRAQPDSNPIRSSFEILKYIHVWIVKLSGEERESKLARNKPNLSVTVVHDTRDDTCHNNIVSNAKASISMIFTSSISMIADNIDKGIWLKKG